MTFDDPSPSSVSLFTGAGGLDLGLEMAGFETVAAVDVDKACVATLRGNQSSGVPLPGRTDRYFLERTKVLRASVADLVGRDLVPGPHQSSWRPDLLVGGPPCQPFSSAGKQRALDDPQGRLFEHFVRLAGELRPRMILFENVRGLVTARGPRGRPGEALHAVSRAFECIGYATRFALLNAADYGLPQRRVRLFMIGSRVSPLPAFPSATHARYPVSGLSAPLKPWVSLGEFLECSPPPDLGDVVRPSPALAEQLGDVPGGSGLKSPGTVEPTRPGGHWGYKQGTFVADLGLPARTVTAASTQDWIRERDGTLRRLTLPECRRLQAFPDSWQFVGSKAAQFRQVGNAVPVLMGEVIGRALKEALLGAVHRAPLSAQWPSALELAIKYTAREQKRNGASRGAGGGPMPVMLQ